MNSRDLLRAIAQTDEKELDATGRFSEIGEVIRSERKKKRRTPRKGQGEICSSS